jgi:hypothetical protein
MFNNFFSESCRLLNNVEKYGGARGAADNMEPARGLLNM